VFCGDLLLIRCSTCSVT